MDVDDFRAIMTVVTLLTFLGIVVWAYGARRKHAFDEAAQMALEEDAPAEANGGGK